mmetsp:Transcript_15149/g.23590  ORF Transcript_15149/g.23590 Transcript_15149/m.23590 type:complete len:228 (+) Transcript_15149:170-853(+)
MPIVGDTRIMIETMGGKKVFKLSVPFTIQGQRPSTLEIRIFFSVCIQIRRAPYAPAAVPDHQHHGGLEKQDQPCPSATTLRVSKTFTNRGCSTAQGAEGIQADSCSLRYILGGVDGAFAAIRRKAEQCPANQANCRSGWISPTTLADRIPISHVEVMIEVRERNQEPGLLSHPSRDGQVSHADLARRIVLLPIACKTCKPVSCKGSYLRLENSDHFTKVLGQLEHGE